VIGFVFVREAGGSDGLVFWALCCLVVGCGLVGLLFFCFWFFYYGFTRS